MQRIWRYTSKKWQKNVHLLPTCCLLFPWSWSLLTAWSNSFLALLAPVNICFASSNVLLCSCFLTICRGEYDLLRAWLTLPSDWQICFRELKIDVNVFTCLFSIWKEQFDLLFPSRCSPVIQYAAIQRETEPILSSSLPGGPGLDGKCHLFSKSWSCLPVGYTWNTWLGDVGEEPWLTSKWRAHPICSCSDWSGSAHGGTSAFGLSSKRCELALAILTTYTVWRLWGPVSQRGL